MLATEKAEAEKSAQRIRAADESYSKYSSGLATASQHQAVIDGLKESMMEFCSHNPGISAKDVMDMILLTHYFDTVGASPKSMSDKLIRHGPAGALKDVVAQIRRDACGDSS
uniref:hypersensitive-induced response protein 1-like n=1 Tax=Erigeron canadensis TaxID=72917 RepID=UPI001CB93973|nr:hypersensitive-induced response protein 1-like [Erigeron canadensis]